MKNVVLSSIIIPAIFLNAKPREEKLERIRKYYKQYGKFDKPLVIVSDDDRTLTDNYARYVVAVEMGIESIPCMTVSEYRKFNPDENQTMTYVVGMFDHNPKEYTWLNPKNIPIEIGDKVVVKTKDMKKDRVVHRIVTVVDVYKSNNPSLLRHKPIVKKARKREV